MIPSFSTLTLDGKSSDTPFANSLTITRDDFANYQHVDKDKIQIAYGLWWPATLRKVGRHHRYIIDEEIGHDQIKGGAFLWGEYGIAVEFEKYESFKVYFMETHRFCRCNGLVEIYWRGKIDYHCTMASASATNVTRFGTSVQLTGRGADAVAHFWASGGDIEQATTATDRIEAAVAGIARKRAKAKKSGKAGGSRNKRT